MVSLVVSPNSGSVDTTVAEPNTVAKKVIYMTVPHLPIDTVSRFK